MRVFIFIIVSLFMSQVFAEDFKEPKLKGVEVVTRNLDLKDFHAYHISEFAEAEGFGERRVIIMPKIVNLSFNKEVYRLTEMKLVSVTDRKKPVVWEYPHKGWLQGIIRRGTIEEGHMKKRSLNEKELVSMNALREGAKWGLEERKDGKLQLTAPLLAGASCIRCHQDYKTGEFMGAFRYELEKMSIDSDKKLTSLKK